jgi:ASC-1-like (ASCH) protein
MKTHELKLDTKYFYDVKSGKKNFEIRKDDRNFKLWDILELKAYENGSYVEDIGGQFITFAKTDKERAETIKVKVTGIWNYVTSNLSREYMEHQSNDNLIKIDDVRKVLNDYFSNDKLPDDYVVLGIKVIE